MRFLATGFIYLFAYDGVHVKVIGRDKLFKYKHQDYLVYADHIQIVNDVFMPLILFDRKDYYAIASQANWGIPIVRRILLSYGGLPVGKNIKQATHLLRVVNAPIKGNAHIITYPEAHVWPYCTDIRSFPATSFNFLVQTTKPSFVMITTYQKRKFSKRPRITVYINGPFFPDTSLPKKLQRKELHDQIFTQLKNRSKLGNCKYYRYQQQEIGG